MREKPQSNEINEALYLASDIVASYVSQNAVKPDNLGPLLESTYAKIIALNEGEASRFRGSQEPAVPISKSVTSDHVICLEDGKKLKMLKRYLRTQYDMSPEDYRRKWDLPADYPMVAPNYAKKRSNLAKQIGLGKAAGSTKKTTRKTTKRKTRKK